MADTATLLTGTDDTSGPPAFQPGEMCNSITPG
jgi:hypothetical protein